MTEQERYLITFLNETFGHHESDIDSEAFAKRLIQRYPQLLSEKVWEGGVFDHPQVDLWNDKYGSKNIEVFIREVKE